MTVSQLLGGGKPTFAAVSQLLGGGKPTFATVLLADGGWARLGVRGRSEPGGCEDVPRGHAQQGTGNPRAAADSKRMRSMGQQTHAARYEYPNSPASVLGSIPAGDPTIGGKVGGWWCYDAGRRNAQPRVVCASAARAAPSAACSCAGPSVRSTHQSPCAVLTQRACTMVALTDTHTDRPHLEALTQSP